MPFLLTVAGLMMIISGAQNTYRQLGAQLRKDFTGPANFTWWLASLGGVGAVGYIPKLRPVALGFMTLIVVVLVLAAKGLFAKATAALESGPVAPVPGRELTFGGALGTSIKGAIVGDVSKAGGLGLPATTPSGINKERDPIGWMLENFGR